MEERGKEGRAGPAELATIPGFLSSPSSCGMLFFLWICRPIAASVWTSNGFAFCVASSRSLRGIPDIDDYHHGLAHSDTLLLIINQECTLL